jgi:hypothetical protein
MIENMNSRRIAPPTRYAGRAAALQTAQLALMNKADTAHPFFGRRSC